MQEKQGSEVIWWCRQRYRSDPGKKEKCHATMGRERGTKMRNIWISSSTLCLIQWIRRILWKAVAGSVRAEFGEWNTTVDKGWMNYRPFKQCAHTQDPAARWDGPEGAKGAGWCHCHSVISEQSQRWGMSLVIAKRATSHPPSKSEMPAQSASLPAQKFMRQILLETMTFQTKFFWYLLPRECLTQNYSITALLYFLYSSSALQILLHLPSLPWNGVFVFHICNYNKHRFISIWDRNIFSTWIWALRGAGFILGTVLSGVSRTSHYWKWHWEWRVWWRKSMESACAHLSNRR